MLRETIALGEELAGELALAASIRAGGAGIPTETNHAPIAADDVFSVDENDVLTRSAASGVLANDTDGDGDSLSATLVDQASNGVASISPDGSFTYSPDDDFSGTDTFTYRASDGTATSNVATVTINVNPSDDDDTNQSPSATDDTYTVEENGVLTIAVGSGVLANDSDPDDDSLIARLVGQADNGSLGLNQDGSFTYVPDNGFTGTDTFTYTADDAVATSNVATVRINVTGADDMNEPFGPVTVGSCEETGLLGVRTDLLPGAPPITATHVNGVIDYSAHSNPPTYGDHHGFDPDGTDSNPGITPRPTGVHTTEQPDEDLVHNLEHGHVWISYNPSLISTSDLADLEQLVRDGAPPDGGGVGVILTPRAANDTLIAVASWARLLTLDTFDPTTIRSFVEINRGKAPEGFITP
jgi:VCBS repeat-containing protein